MGKTKTIFEENKVLASLVALFAVIGIALASIVVPLGANAATPTSKLGDITQNKSADGKKVLVYNGSVALYDNNGALECKAPTDADFDANKATFTLQYASTSEGANFKNQQATQNAAALKSADHYSIISPSGQHLTMGNEDRNTAGNVTLSLRDEAFLSATNVEYMVNVAGGSLVGWRGYKIYSDRFSTDGVNQWFGINAVNSTNTMLPKGISAATLPCGDERTPEGGFEIYELPKTHTVTYVDWDDSVLQGPTTVQDGEAEPAAPANPTRAADDNNTYTFTEWVKTTDADGNVTYKASYEATPKQKETTTTVKVHDEDGDPVVGAKVTVVCDGNVVETYTIAQGDADKVVTLPSDECRVEVDAPDDYVDPESTPVNPGGDTEILVKKSTYTVTYKNWDGTVLQGPDTVKKGEAEPAAPANPTRAADDNNTYTFTEWVKTTDADGNVTYTANYEATPKATTTIKVRDEDGNPLGGATVTVVCDGKVVKTYTTDAGKDEVVTLDSDTCTVKVDAPEGYDDPADTPANPGGDTNVTVNKTKYDVTATIVDSKTGAVIEATVDIYDADGNKVAEGVKPGDTVKLPKGDYVAKASGDIAGYKPVADVPFTVSDKSEDVVLKADAKPTTTIKVRDEDGEPVVGAKVTVVCGDTVVDEYTIADGDADKKIVLDSDTCTVKVDAPEGYDDPADTPANPDGDTNVTVNKTKYDVTATIVDSKTGEKLDGIVDIYDADGNKVAEGVKPGDTVKLPKGDYVAKQNGDIDGYKPAKDVPFAITDTKKDVTLQADEKPSTVTVTVHDTDGNPLDGTITVNCGDGDKTYTVKGGKATFEADAGTCNVTVESPGYDTEDITITVPGKGKNVEEVVILKPTPAPTPNVRDISVTTEMKWVKDNGGTALAWPKGAVVSVVLMDGDKVVAEFDLNSAEASKMLTLPESSNYKAKAVIKGIGQEIEIGPVDGVVDADGNVRITLSNAIGIARAGNIVTFHKVRADNGNALAGAQLSIVDADGAVLEEWTSDGLGRIVSLKAGNYTYREVKAPNGFEIADDIAFTIGDDGQLTVGDNAVAIFEVTMEDAYVGSDGNGDGNGGNGGADGDKKSDANPSNLVPPNSGAPVGNISSNNLGATPLSRTGAEIGGGIAATALLSLLGVGLIVARRRSSSEV